MKRSPIASLSIQRVFIYLCPIPTVGFGGCFRLLLLPARVRGFCFCCNVSVSQSGEANCLNTPSALDTRRLLSAKRERSRNGGSTCLCRHSFLRFSSPVGEPVPHAYLYRGIPIYNAKDVGPPSFTSTRVHSRVSPIAQPHTNRSAGPPFSPRPAMLLFFLHHKLPLDYASREYKFARRAGYPSCGITSTSYH